jgi:hypothetical protein
MKPHMKEYVLLLSSFLKWRYQKKKDFIFGQVMEVMEK